MKSQYRYLVRVPILLIMVAIFLLTSCRPAFPQTGEVKVSTLRRSGILNWWTTKDNINGEVVILCHVGTDTGIDVSGTHITDAGNCNKRRVLGYLYEAKDRAVRGMEVSDNAQWLEEAIITVRSLEGEELLKSGILTPTPIPTETPLPTLTPSPTPTPIPWALFSNGLKIETICLEVSQSYSGSTAPQFFLPIYETIEEYLSSVGLEVVSPGETCSGTLSFSLLGEPLGAQYTNPQSSGLMTCYAGAYMQSSTTFSVQGKSQLHASSEFTKDPPYSVEYCQSPEEAPYEWQQLFFRNLGNVWGPEYLYHVIETSTDKEITYDAGVALAYLEPEFRPILVGDLNHPNGIVRGWIGIGVSRPLLPKYSGSSYYIEWDVPPAVESPKLIEAAKVMQPTLIFLLNDENVDVRAAAALLLGTIGPDAKEAIPFLAEALISEEDRLEADAQENCSTPRDYAFRFEDQFFMAGIWAAGRIGSQEAVSALIELLRRQDEPAFLNVQDLNVRPGAIRVTLMAITGQDFFVDADQWQKWWEVQK